MRARVVKDALVYPDGPTGWWSAARASGEKIGWIEERKDGRFHISAGIDDDPIGTSPLLGVDHGPHISLEDAMAAIAYRLGGTCEQRQR